MLFVQRADENGERAPAGSGDREPDELARALEAQAGTIRARIVAGRHGGEKTVTLPLRFAHAMAASQVAAARMLRRRLPAPGDRRR